MNISFEVFPPKREQNFDTAFEITSELSLLKPQFISVTYGAGGSKAGKTLEIASYIKNSCSTPAVAHLTCVGSTKKEILERCREFERENIEYVLALRGDRPKDMSDEQFNAREFIHASDLISFIKENSRLKVMASCYPEMHPEAVSFAEDIRYMKEKQDHGACDFISQMFFDNECFLRFTDKAAAVGITAPIHAGIMPVTSAKQLGTSVSLSGSSVPGELINLIDRYGESPEDMYKAGIEYAAQQIRDLQKAGVAGVHIYTMNKPKTAEDILKLVK